MEREDKRYGDVDVVGFGDMDAVFARRDAA